MILLFALLTILSQSSNRCFSACPPWYQKCTKQCMQKIWFEQDQWIEKINTDQEFRKKALAYIPTSKSSIFNINKKDGGSNQNMNNNKLSSNKCFSACPPWHIACTKQCMNTVWYKQEKWSNLIKADPVFRKKAFEYIPNEDKKIFEQNININKDIISQIPNLNKKLKVPINLLPDKKNQPNQYYKENNCHSACPPWFTMCTMQCMNNPWYKQQKWIRMIRTDPNFRQKALEYIPKEYKTLFEKENTSTRTSYYKLSNQHNKTLSTKIRPSIYKYNINTTNNLRYKINVTDYKTFKNRRNFNHQNIDTTKISQKCNSACPPWFPICTKQCMPTVWYKQPRWKNMIKNNQDFRQKSLNYISKDIVNSIISEQSH